MGTKPISFDIFATLGIAALPAAAQYFILIAVLLHVASFVYWITKLRQKQSLQEELKFKGS